MNKLALVSLVAFLVLCLLIISCSSSVQVDNEEEWERDNPQGKSERGMKQGEWTTLFTNGNVAEIVNYKNDTLHGVTIHFTPTGDTSLYEKYKMGIKVDTFKLFSNGKLNLIEWRDSLGLQQGEFRVYLEDSLSQIGHYLNDQFHGQFKFYDYKTGKIKEEYEYTNGVKSGKWIYYNENGDTLKVEKY